MSPVDNQPYVVVLQHPSEVKQSKGTLGLLAQSLSRCVVLVGEDFSQHAQLAQIIRDFGNRVSLLYPSEQANIIQAANDTDQVLQNHCIILLDATWKKAYRMFNLSSVLHQIPHISLPEGITGQYLIRKTRRNNALSTLEACCYALGIIEQAPQKYQALLTQFVAFNQFQLSFIPTGHSVRRSAPKSALEQ